MIESTISPKKIQFRPTFYGILFIIVLAAMTLGAMNYNNNMGFLLSFLLGSMAIVSLFHTYNNLRGLHILSIAARPVFAGETAVFELQIGVGNLPKSAISFSFMKSELTRQDIHANVTQRVSVKIVTEKRGMFNPGPLRIETQYPLGLFRCIAKVALDTSCLVYPKPIPGPFVIQQYQVSPETNGEKEIPGIGDFQGLQPYLPGEPIQHIYWKAFSREQGLQVKRFAKFAGKTLIFDWDAISGVNLEQKLSRFCDLVLKSHRLNLLYGLNLPGKTILPHKGDTHRQNCLKALALFGQPPIES